MPPKKKPYISKKNARTYHIVQSGTKSGQNKVQFKPHGHNIPWEEKDLNVVEDGQFDDADEDDDNVINKNGNTSKDKYDYNQHLINNENDDDEIFNDEFNDEDYDYYQHLKPIGGGVLISKEGNIISNVENEFFDDEIQKALENDEEVNDLDENFVEKANDSLSGDENDNQDQNNEDFNIDDIDIGDIGDIKEIIEDDSDDDQDDDNQDDIVDENINGELVGEDNDEYKKYQKMFFSNENDKDIKDYFKENKSETKEKTFLEEKLEYAIMNNLDSESDDLIVPGFIETKDYNGVLDEFIKTNRKEQYQPDVAGIKEAIKKMAENDNSDEEEKYDIIYIKEKPQWDVESILSTYTNTENHPNILAVPEDEKAIKINKKGFPILQNDDKDDEENDQADDQPINEGLARNKNETKEEKKARKNALKELRKNKRVQKKELKNDFRKEISRQQNMNAGRIVNKTVIQLN